MVNDGDFPTKSRKVPPANSASNFFQEEVLGNKTDTAVTSPGTTKSVVAMAKGSLTNEATILAAVLAVQNNTRFVAAVPAVMELPLAGDVSHMIAANLYDDVGHMEDPDNEEILVRVFDAAGAYVTAALYDDLALTTPCSVATDQVNFPTASGWRVIPKIAVGKYIFYFKVSTTSTVQALLFEFGYDEGGNIQSQYRPSYIGDEDTMVADIYADTQAIITLIGTPVTDLATDIADCDAQVVTSEGVVTGALGTHDSDIKTLIGTPVTDLATDIADCDAQVVTSEGVVTGALATHDSDIKTLIGTPITDVMTDLLTILFNSIENVDSNIATNVEAITDVGNTATTFKVNTVSTNLANLTLIVMSGTYNGIARRIESGTADTITLDTALPFIPATGDTFFIAPRWTPGIMGALSTHDTDIKTLIGTPVTDLATDIADADAQVVTSEGVITALIGTPAVDLAADIAAIPLVTPDAAGTAAGLLAVPLADSALNVIATDVIGNKTDTVLGDSLVAMSKSITLGVSLVKAVTDLIPDAGALTSLAQDLTVAKTGADADTLETLSDQLDTITTSTNKLAGETPVVGTATQNWNAAEANIVSIGADGVKTRIHSLFISLHALTAAATITIRMYAEVNGTERLFYRESFVIGVDTPGQLLINGTVGVHEIVRVTAQSDTAADDGLGIAFDYLKELF
jgi:uncharacterized protein YbcI